MYRTSDSLVVDKGEDMFSFLVMYQQRLMCLLLDSASTIVGNIGLFKEALDNFVAGA